jgi:tetratricopeptide repeat protein 8
MLVLTHQRAKVCLRMDQPLAALELYSNAAEQHPGNIGLLLGQARIQEAVGQHAHSLALYQQVSTLGPVRQGL